MSTDHDEADDFADEVAAELLADYQRRNQDAFADEWGPDLISMLAENYGFNPSPDGTIIGIQFNLKNGTTFRASMPTAWFVQFHLEMQLALETAAKRMDYAGGERRH